MLSWRASLLVVSTTCLLIYVMLKLCFNFLKQFFGVNRMTENIDNIVLEHLRHIRGKVDKTEQSIEDLKLRMSRLESAILSVKREVADGYEAEIHQQSTNDRIIERLERIERRLDLQE